MVNPESGRARPESQVLEKCGTRNLREREHPEWLRISRSAGSGSDSDGRHVAVSRGLVPGPSIANGAICIGENLPALVLLDPLADLLCRQGFHSGVCVVARDRTK